MSPNRPGEYTGNPATTGRGLDLLTDWLAKHPRQAGKSAATQIREAANAGDELARKILQSGVFDLETK